MKRLKWNRKFSILVLIMFITVTFASFNTNLFIDGKAYVRVDRDIRITNIRLLETEYDGYENVGSEYSNRTISTDVSLPRQASSVTYEVTISNVSDKRYKITDIIEDSYDNRDVKYELIDASIGNIVEPHTTKTFKVKFTNNVTVVEEDDVYETKTYTFEYTGGEQKFVAPFDGDYTLEVWGASGGGTTTIQNSFGYGGYSKGTIHLQKNKTLYINVGGQGIQKCDEDYGYRKVYSGGYNGGGDGCTWVDNKCSGSGGGATHISFISGLLEKLSKYKGTLIDNKYYSSENIIIVAGGGGGQGNNGYNGRAGSGGGYNGVDASAGDYWWAGGGGTQISGGLENTLSLSRNSGFGHGSSAIDGGGNVSGGGGGFFGGGTGSGSGGYGGGGSGYIANPNLNEKVMYCYNCTESDELQIKTISTNQHSANPETNVAKEGNGYAKITVTRKIEDGSEYDYDYTGSEQTFTVPYTGVYKLEVWGSEGAVSKWGGTAGRGGYSTGLINLSKNDSLFISVGGQSNFNGGGGTESGGEVGGAGGGGATHIATTSGQLKTLSNKLDDILIVAGGGGAAERLIGGSGGGFEGNDGTSSETYPGYGSGGTQTAGGIGMINNDRNPSRDINGSFGQAGIGTASDSGPGGGGGFYGGGATTYAGAGGGGSGYIGNPRLYEKVMYCYDCKESNNKDTKTISTKSNSSMPKSYQSKLGTGYSRITLVKRTINRTKLTLDFTFEEYLNGNEYTFGFTGDEQTFTVPKTGYYKVELWGAQGGTDDDSEPGDGAYTSGKIKLNAGEKLYLYVGGQGITGNHNNTAEYMDGGWNGGGYGKQSDFDWTNPTYYSSGGGSTDIRLVNGNWNNTESLNSRIMVAAGGGGFHHDYHNYPDGVHANIYGGAGGGLVGKLPKFMIYITYNPDYASTPATQTQGGIAISAISNTRSETRDGQYGMANQYTTQSVGAGGGGGFYGGAGCGGGTGGSSYISGHNGSVAITSANDITPRNDSNGNQCTDGTTDITCSLHYSNYKFTDTKMIDGEGYNWTTEVGTEVVGMPTHDGSSTMTGNEGNGFAKITLVEDIPEYAFDYTGDAQEFVVPYNGIYKVELWGASGSKRNTSYVPGNGAYVSGNIELKKNDKYYIYVGQNKNTAEQLTFNGSLSSTSNGGPGGGATDIRFIKGSTWNEFDSLKSRIMVAGAGGADSNNSNYPSGSGGGLVGYETNGSSGPCQTPGTQISFGTENCSTYDVKSNGAFGMGSPTGSTGGSGWFGGAGGRFIHGGGTGGSSFISGHPGCVSITENSTLDNISFVNDSNGIACNDSTSAGYNSLGYNMDSACNKHYSGKVFTDTVMIDGQGYVWDENGKANSALGMPTHDGRSTMIGNVGNGYARITLIEKRDNYNITYDLDGGTLKNSKNTYSEFDDNLTLGTPSKAGHTFLGWYGGKNLFNKENAVLDKELVRQDGTSRDKTDWFVSEYIEVKPSTDYYVSASSNKIGQANAFYDENKNFIVNIDAITGKVTSPANAKYMRINGNTVVIDTVMVEEGNSATEYEAYITTPQKSLVISNGSFGNRTYHAFWRDDSLLCRKATTLHSTTCSWAYEDTKACNGAGYATGDPITYGTLVDGNIKAGDAFDCDVNGDGIFDSVNERFYYLIDLEGNSNYAVLLYSNLVKNGVKTNSFSYIEWGIENANNLGPTVAMGDLPTTSQWGNVSLSSTSRQLVSDDNTLVTTAGDNAILNYSGKSARLPTYKEIRTACGVHSSKLNEYCEYVLEGTSYDLGVGSSNYGIWLETPMSVESTKVYEIDTHWRSIGNNYTTISKHFMVKPVIEVPKSKLRY